MSDYPIILIGKYFVAKSTLFLYLQGVTEKEGFKFLDSCIAEPH